MLLDIMAIPLTQGLYALVDGENYEWLNQHKWHAHKNENTFYAVRWAGKRPNQRRILMHRELLGLTKGDGKEIDHRNHCGLDNRNQNLRICTHGQNQQNQQGAIRGGTSQYKGVCWSKGATYKGKQYKGNWQAQIRYNQKTIPLGHFDNEIEAAKAYDKKAKELFGEFANCNFN